MSNNLYQQYLNALKRPFKKLTKLEFLNPDNSVAFSLGNETRNGYMSTINSSAFVQSGTLNVSLQNGQRRQADVTLSNIDDAFSFAVNKLWYGRRVRLSMGLSLADNSPFLLPQGVFYLSEPKSVIKPNERSISYSLVDKWAYLDGSLFGNLENTYQVNVGANIFDAMRAILRMSRYDFSGNATSDAMVDNVEPIFTSYYNNKTYFASQSDGSITTDISMLDVPYTITTSSTGNFADVILALNEVIVGWVGYDQTGALRVDPSQDDVDDAAKPNLWTFSPENSLLCGIEETINDKEVYNDIIVSGQGLTEHEVWGRATNFDPRSDTNVNIIGRKTLRQEDANYWNTTQCADLAKWLLKRKTVLQKQITISSAQMFHLTENSVVSVVRTDKPGSPTERHLIQSFSLPVGETGSMSINAVSVNDLPEIDVTMSTSDDEEA